MVSDPEPTGYDGLSSRLVPLADLRLFLQECFGIADNELFAAHADYVADELEKVPPGIAVFPAFWTYWNVTGHFSMGYSLGLEGRLVARVSRRQFAERLAAHFHTHVLYGGDAEPPSQWNVVTATGQHLLAELSETSDRYHLVSATGPVAGLEIRINKNLGEPD